MRSKTGSRPSGASKGYGLTWSVCQRPQNATRSGVSESNGFRRVRRTCGPARCGRETLFLVHVGGRAARDSVRGVIRHGWSRSARRHERCREDATRRRWRERITKHREGGIVSTRRSRNSADATTCPTTSPAESVSGPGAENSPSDPPTGWTCPWEWRFNPSDPYEDDTLQLRYTSRTR